MSKLNTAMVSFVCQRCLQPLKLENSFNTLDYQTFAELKGDYGNEHLEEAKNLFPFSLNKNYADESSFAKYVPPNPLIGHFLNIENESIYPISNSYTQNDSIELQKNPTDDSRINNECSLTNLDNLSADLKNFHLSKDNRNEVDEGGKKWENHCQQIQSQSLLREDGYGFTLVGEPEINSGENLSRRLKITTELFDILSGQTEIDHPLCEECTDQLLDQLDQDLKTAEEEHARYSNFLEKINENAESESSLDYDKEIEMLKDEQARLEEVMKDTEKKQCEVTEQITMEKERSKSIQTETKLHYKNYNEYKRLLFEYEDAQRSVDNQLNYATRQLEKLKKTNVFNTTFLIWHSGHFGTINGFRLGRLPDCVVDWNEINAAWGQVVLLLHSIAKKIGLTFQRYRLVPYCNHSYIECLSDKSKELPLYGMGGFKFFWDTKFDQAMVAFIDCLQQFKEEMECRNPGICLPYKMDKGRLEDPKTGISYSIKVQFNSEEQWTKALKFMLTNLKWALVWVTSEEFLSTMGASVSPKMIQNS